MSNKQGSTLALVMIATSVAVLLLGSYMSTAVFESKSIVSNEAVKDAERAAESLANYGAAQVIHHFHQDPLYALQHWTNRTLDLPENVRDYITQSSFQIDGLKISVGPTASSFEERFIDPLDRYNIDDPLKGRMVLANTFSVLAEATVHHSGKSITRYAELPIQLRDSPFFSNAIFYNMDMELMPQTLMNIHGPVYGNGDIYLSTAEGLNFYPRIRS